MAFEGTPTELTQGHMPLWIEKVLIKNGKPTDLANFVSKIGEVTDKTYTLNSSVQKLSDLSKEEKYQSQAGGIVDKAMSSVQSGDAFWTNLRDASFLPSGGENYDQDLPDILRTCVSFVIRETSEGKSLYSHFDKNPREAMTTLLKDIAALKMAVKDTYTPLLESFNRTTKTSGKFRDLGLLNPMVTIKNNLDAKDRNAIRPIDLPSLSFQEKTAIPEGAKLSVIEAAQLEGVRSVIQKNLPPTLPPEEKDRLSSKFISDYQPHGLLSSPVRLTSEKLDIMKKLYATGWIPKTK